MKFIECYKVSIVLSILYVIYYLIFIAMFYVGVIIIFILLMDIIINKLIKCYMGKRELENFRGSLILVL